MTEDGLELLMSSNHYGHFLLTNLLGGLLKASAPSRIVNVSSLLHITAGRLDFTDLNFRNVSYNTDKGYSRSKLCNVLMTRELGNKLRGSGKKPLENTSLIFRFFNVRKFSQYTNYKHVYG